MFKYIYHYFKISHLHKVFHKAEMTAEENIYHFGYTRQASQTNSLNTNMICFVHMHFYTHQIPFQHYLVFHSQTCMA